jgi:hypothetical protein
MKVDKTRWRVALVLLAAAIVLNLIILVRGEESPGWPLAAMLLLAVAGTSLLVRQRPWQ